MNDIDSADFFTDNELSADPGTPGRLGARDSIDDPSILLELGGCLRCNMPDIAAQQGSDVQ
jgi:hypothetical protein